MKRDNFIEKIITKDPEKPALKSSMTSELESVEELHDIEVEDNINLKRDNFIEKIIDKDPEKTPVRKMK